MSLFGLGRNQKTFRPIKSAPSGSKDGAAYWKRRGLDFKTNDPVDTFYNVEWLEGLVTKPLDAQGRVAVRLRVSKEVREFEVFDLRAHEVSFDEQDRPDVPIAMSKKRKKESFSPGELIEVRTDEEGFRGAWLTATIVNPVKNGNFLVEYKDLKNDDNTEPLREVIDANNIRPYPPELVVVDGYSLKEKVNALYNDSWWEGEICKILCGGRYKVYFKGTDDEMVFRYFDLRPHQDWIDDRWVLASSHV